LQPRQPRIKTALGDKRIMGSGCNNLPFVKHHNPVGFFHCRKAVRHD
jgi:hypothetical protein